MKKILKITGIVILVLLVVLITVPFLFKNQIKAKVEEEINKQLNATVHFESLSLNLFRSFPDFYMSLNGLTVVGKDTFARDTLVAFKSFSTSLDLMSVIKMTDIKIKSVVLEEPRIHAIVLKDGQANWNIAKPSTDTVATVDTAKSEPMAFKVSLKRFAIEKAYISYDDQKGGMKAKLDNFNFELSGDLSSDFTTIKIHSFTDAIDFAMGGIPYVNKASNKIDIAIDADLKNQKFTLKENEVAINDIVLGWNGSVEMKDSAIITDITFATKKTEFKSLLSMVPVIYMKGFESLKTSGSLKLDGYVKGTLQGKETPSAGLSLVVENANFKYPALPKSVDNINIDLKVKWDGVQNDNTTVDLNKFHLEIAQNPIDLALHVKTPMSDPAVDGKFVSKIDLATLADVVPLDSTAIAGRIETNVEIAGKLSMIQQQKFEQFKADGTVGLYGITYKSPALKQGALIEKAVLNFSPKFVELAAFDVKVGNSDVHLNGKLENFIPYALKGETIKGNLTLSSNVLDLNEFMPKGQSVDTVQKVDTTQLAVVEVPKNINFTFTSQLNKVIFDKLEITNMIGVIKVAEGRVAMEKLNMNLLQGSMLMNGEYNTQDVTKPLASFTLDMKDIDIPSSFNAFTAMQQLAPIAKDAKGKISVLFSFTTLLDAHMSPVLSTMNGKGKLSSKQIEISNSPTFNKIADATKYEKLRKVTMNDVNLSFKIENGRIYVDPFDTKLIGNKTTISGDQGLDQTMNYLMVMGVPSSQLGSAVGSLNSALASKGVNVLGDMVNLGITITGTVADPKIGVTLKGSEGKSVTESAKEQVKKVIEDKKAQVKAEASKKAQEILEKAQKEADAIKAAAKKTADAVRSESVSNGDKLVKEASNPFAKAAAKETAKKMKKEGDAKAQKIEDEAAKKADGIMKKAQAEADKLK